jgi:glycosyltransferase involved in cell wall biosynthesis
LAAAKGFKIYYKVLYSNKVIQKSNLNKISIIIVTYNAAKTLVAAINSVINQPYLNFELIIIDGNSNDNTVKIIEEYGAAISYFISEPDNGIYDAMNKGIKAAKGDWLFFLGADDTLNKHVLQQIFEEKTIDPAIQLVYGKINILGTNKTQGVATNYINLIENNIPHQAIFYHKTIFSTITGYNVQYKILADYYLNLKIFEQGLFKTTFVDTAIVTFNSKGLSNRTVDFLFFNNQLAYFIKVKNIHKNTPYLAKYYFFIGVGYILQKQYFIGLKHLLQAIKISNKKSYSFMLVIDFLLGKIHLRKKYALA